MLRLPCGAYPQGVSQAAFLDAKLVITACKARVLTMSRRAILGLMRLNSLYVAFSARSIAGQIGHKVSSRSRVIALIFEMSSIGAGEYRMRLFKSPFAKEPPFNHGQAPRTAVLFCNLGTPDTPSAPDVRRYLREFLSDPRVVEIPRLLWLLIFHGVILRTRPAKSAEKYASIWRAEGSPLKIWTEKQAKLLKGWLG